MAIAIINGEVKRFPEGTTDREIQFIKDEIAAGRPAPSLDKVRGMLREVDGGMSAGEVAVTAAKNLPGSMYQLGADTVEAALSPIDTLDAVTKLGAGVLQNILPESFVQMVGEDKESRELASAVGQMYIDKYGSVEGFKAAFAQDPAGVISDAATVLGIGAATKVPLLKQASDAASLVDPVAATLKAGETAVGAAGQALGRTTGAGAEPITEAFQAGREGGERGEQFRESMRNDLDMPRLLDDAKQNLSAFRQKRNEQYRIALDNGLFNDPTILDFTKIDDAFDRVFQRTTFGGKTVNKRSQAELKKAKDKIDEWYEGDPAKFHTVEGFDALKQAIGDILDGIPYEASQARSAIQDLYDAVRTEINTQAPDYAKVMKAYAESTETIREIERSLSLGQKATADTALRKLMSIMRNNVNTNFGERSRLLAEIEGAPHLLRPRIAGSSMSDFVPGGLQGAGMGLGMAGLTSVTDLATGLGYGAVSSPRLVGEAAHLAGRAAGMPPQSLIDALGKVPLIYNPQTRLALAEMQQIKEQEQ